MKHFGDITKIHGWEVPIVDVVTGGSPCQDLSVAGKREGLAGERSGLFMEQIRIVKEMREHDIKTNGHMGVYVRPRYLVWENVTGAFSSNGGEDFRVVLEEICKVADKDTVIPGPSGKWQPAGCIVGNGWSVAWRTHDAQYWGVPQRRKRICVLADFGGGTAGEILFELQRETADGEKDKIVGYSRRECEPEVQSVCESLRGDIEKGERKGEEVAGSVGESVDSTISFQERAGKAGGVKESLSKTSEPERSAPCQTSTYCIEGNVIDREAKQNGKGYKEEEAYTLNSVDRHGVVYEAYQHHGWKEGNSCNTLTAGQNNTVRGDTPLVCEGVVSVSHGGFMVNADDSGVAHTLQATDYKDPPVACFAINAHSAGVTENVSQTLLGEKNDNHHPCVYGQSSFGQYTDGCGTLKANGGDIGGQRNACDTVGSLCARDYKGVGSQYVDEGKVIVQKNRDI